ncbi:ABC transporter ATP-binding protein [Microlunatus sp. GCM10028923]|uniref:ABC transporter ATP-binding protein n=1 Tax=Microlunatus sp. GCM10028923 TaxID=3273400 RepID=UPI003615BC48
MTEPLLEVTDLVVHYPVKREAPWRPRRFVHAVNGVSFSIGRGETLALVGESGCGKSTVGKTIMRFQRPTGGTVRFAGRDVHALDAGSLRRLRRDLQFVFQDPYASLPSRLSVGEIIAEPLIIHGVGTATSRRDRVRELLRLVGLRPELISRYPHEFSGGQRQRVGIARALALEPSLLILDEPVSALDVSVQAQVVNLLGRLQSELGLSYLFVAHDLAVVRQLAHRVAVMYLGRIVEHGSTAEVFDRARHPYTQALLSAVPISDPAERGRNLRIRLQGDLPDPLDLPSGCAFRTRCWQATDRCAAELPELIASSGTTAACHYAGEPARLPERTAS